MALTEAQKLAREGKLTASRVACLMTGDKVKIMALWKELCGDPLHENDDLDDIWAVQLGSTTEELNLAWYERVHNRMLTKRGEVVLHPDYSWAAATLDGFDGTIPGPVETKHVGGFEKFETILARYQPQLQWQMEVTGCTKAALSVIEGARKPRVEIVARDKDYADELMSRALRLMECVWSMREPVVLDPMEFKVTSVLRDYNYTGNNHWAAYANDFLNHRNAAKMFDDAEDKLKGMVPHDAKSVSGHGVIARRDRANRVSIRGVNDKRTQKPK